MLPLGSSLSPPMFVLWFQRSQGVPFLGKQHFASSVLRWGWLVTSMQLQWSWTPAGSFLSHKSVFWHGQTEHSHTGTQIVTRGRSCHAAGQEVPPRAQGWIPVLGWEGAGILAGIGTVELILSQELGFNRAWEWSFQECQLFILGTDPEPWLGESGRRVGIYSGRKRICQSEEGSALPDSWEKHRWIWCHGLQNYSVFLISPLFNYLILSMYFKFFPL